MSDDMSCGLMKSLVAAVQLVCGAKHNKRAVPDKAEPKDPAATFRGNPLPYSGMSALTPADLECVDRRHLCRKPPTVGEAKELSRQVVGAGKRCRHGWPQAIVYDPIYREKPGKRYRLGDTTRLTCPLLVTAIDKLEKGGAIDRYNERLATDPEWKASWDETNEAHRLLRLELIGDRSAELEDVRTLLGENAYAIAMRSGLASLRPGAKPDVKCLHAQVADELVRDGGNIIAQQALRDIEDQGVQVDGSGECCDNCDVGIPLELARWRLNKCKNNVGKRLSRGRKQSAASSRATSRASSLAGDNCSEIDELQFMDSVAEVAEEH
eukprot:TRINITY_DN39331_c0_g1_i1.p1 TRINITY_DN39331_c0_g1~~TRINITY_DN39331_c0_g1_i1.p1  ORF type:complete len:324 (+),score=52.45 TRINITY_DN39331_c0_g1_i1:53-1024(+)